MDILRWLVVGAMAACIVALFTKDFRAECPNLESYIAQSIKSAKSEKSRIILFYDEIDGDFIRYAVYGLYPNGKVFVSFFAEDKCLLTNRKTGLYIHPVPSNEATLETLRNAKVLYPEKVTF